MLFKPDLNQATKTAGRRVASGARRRTVSLSVTLLILGGLGYIAWTAFQQKQPARARPDLPVPVLAASPRIQDVPVYLEGVGAVRALNTVTVRSQVDGKLISVNFTEGQDVRKGDVLGEIDRGSTRRSTIRPSPRRRKMKRSWPINGSTSRAISS